MAEFTIHPRAVRQAAGSIDSCYGKMNSIRNRISSAKSVLKGMPSTAVVCPSLNVLEVRTAMHNKAFGSMQTALSSCVTRYETAERLSSGKSVSVIGSLIQDTFDKHSPGWKLFDSEKTKSWGTRGWNGAVARYRGKGKSEEYYFGAAATGAVSFGAPGLEHDFEKAKIKRGDGKLGKKYKDEHWVRDKDGQYSFPEMTEYAEKKGTIAEAKIEGNAEASLYGKTWGNDNANAKLTIGRAEAHGSAQIGLYGYDKNGKKVLAPAVEATVGTSVCVANLKGEAKIGNDMFNTGADGEISVGKASAEATAKATLFGKDKNGKWNPELKASASAEAIAAEAKGSAHVTIAGVEGKVNGSVNFGVGAHADIGVVDGKIKCDIGASLGVGASVGFEIDTKPLVNAMVSGAKALWPGNWGKK